MIMRAGLTSEIEERKMEKELMKGKKLIDEIGSRLKGFLTTTEQSAPIVPEKRPKAPQDDWAGMDKTRGQGSNWRPSSGVEQRWHPR
jgi:hypothetical protein